MGKIKERKRIRLLNFILLTVAGAINSFGVVLFLSPVKLYDSGISGTSMFLAQITPEYMTFPIFLLILNLPLFLFGLKRQGITFTIYSLYAVFVYSAFSWIIINFFPMDITTSSPFGENDLLLCALFGGALSGVGSGLTIRFGGALDGIEVMSVIFAKKLGITVGTFVMIYNSILYLICGIVRKSWILPLYSVIAYMAALKTVDFIVEGLDRCKSVIIVTTKAKEVCEQLSKEFQEGITLVDAKGFYSDSPKKVVYMVLNRFQIIKMKNIVHTIDCAAYISIGEVSNVFKAC